MKEQSSPVPSMEDLVIGHFDGTLSVDEEKTLATALQTSTKVKQLFLSFMRMEGRLHSLGHDGFLREPNQEFAVAKTVPQHQSADVTPVVQTSQRRFPLFAVSTSLAICAAVILMLSAGFFGTSSVSASSVLQKAQRAAEELVDRTYNVTITRAKEGSRQRKLTINARGGRRFVMRPDDEAYVIGNDGNTFWAARTTGPISVTKNFRSLAPELQRKIPNRRLIELATSPNEPLLLGMADLLSLIKRKHNVQLVEYAGGPECHLSAKIKPEKRNAPTAIDIWANVETGVVHRAESSWSNGQQMRFDLVESVQLSDQWYHHSAHAPGREVVNLDTVSPR